MTPLRLRTRLTLWFSASILIILGPFLVGVALLQWRSMSTALDHHLHEDLEVAAELLEFRGNEIVWLGGVTADLGYDASASRWVEVYSPDGRGLFFRGMPSDPAVRRQLGPVGAAEQGIHSFLTPAGASVRAFVDKRVVGGRDVWLRAVRTEDDLRDNLRRLAWIFALVAPLAVLMASIAGHLASGRMLSPLAKMAERARTISAERLEERLPVGSSGDELDQLAAVFNDTFARLEASFVRLKRFTADVSHELRTPLTAIRSVGEVGLREHREAAEYEEVIGSMLEEADRLTRVVDTLLTLSRWESGRVQPASERLDLVRIALDVSAQLLVLAEDRDVVIDTTGLTSPLELTGDPVMLRQAVTNVVDNAIKFTRRGTRVTLWARVTGAEMELIVDDEGPGIAPDQREFVLERFYRVNQGRRGDRDGAGLGLAIVQWAVSANDGRVELADNPAGGARVILAFRRV